MTKPNSVNILEPWKYDVLLLILKDAFRVLYLSYLNIYSQKLLNPYRKPETAKHWYLEDKITDDIIKETITIQKQETYRFDKQQSDFEDNVRIDIAILYSLKFSDNSKDLKIECKLLNKDKLKYVIQGGFVSFKNNKYARDMRLAGMLFYNTIDKIENNLNFLNNSIIKYLPSNEILKEEKLFDNFEYSYKSKHSRENNRPIDLYSCIFDYSELVIENERN